MPSSRPDVYKRQAYSFELDLGGTDVDIDLGDGADEVNVSGGMSMLYGRKAIEAVIDFAKEQLDTVVEGSHIVISGGAGDDTIAVDTTAAYYDLLGADVRIDAGADFDRMHLTGELAEMADVEDRIAGSLTQLHLETQDVYKRQLGKLCELLAILFRKWVVTSCFGRPYNVNRRPAFFVLP